MLSRNVRKSSAPGKILLNPRIEKWILHLSEHDNNFTSDKHLYGLMFIIRKNMNHAINNSSQDTGRNQLLTGSNSWKAASDLTGASVRKPAVAQPAPVWLQAPRSATVVQRVMVPGKTQQYDSRGLCIKRINTYRYELPVTQGMECESRLL